MKTETDKLNECADWHDDAASRLELATGTADQSAESANKSWAEQHRSWAKSIRMAEMPNVGQRCGKTAQDALDGVHEAERKAD